MKGLQKQNHNLHVCKRWQIRRPLFILLGGFSQSTNVKGKVVDQTGQPIDAQPGQSARDLVNVIRARAGMWSFDNNGNTPLVQDNSAAMVAATPATITIPYLLEERSREYFGDGRRWLDLVRTQEWGNLASSYQIAGTSYGDHTAKTITRNIQPYLYLRPIPIGQLNNMQMSAADLAAYQNPNYQ